jgi:hypothetical protein
LETRDTMRMKQHPQFFISKRPRRSPWVGITIGIDLGDIWSHYCTLNEDGEVIDRGRFRTNAAGVDKRFRNIDSALVAMENGTHSIWVSEQIKELGHEVIVGNVRELRAISHSDRKSDKVDAEKIARYAPADRTPDRGPARDADVDPRPGCAGSLAYRCGELGTRSGQTVRVSPTRFFHPLFCEAMPGRASPRPG